MITIEKITPPIKEILVDKLQRTTLDETDNIDNQTDLNRSQKVVDKNGNTLMLIECIPRDIYPNDEEKSDKGCFIKRFEFAENLEDIQTWEDFFSGFLTGVKYSLILCDNERFETYYKYMWIELPKGEDTVIQEIFPFMKVREGQDTVIYIYRWEQN